MKDRIYKDPFLDVVYYENRWVWVPVLFAPKNAPSEDGKVRHFQFIPVDGQKLPDPFPRRCLKAANAYITSSIKETILPWMLSEEKLKKLCTPNDIPMGWLTGLYPHSTEKNKSLSSSQESRKCKDLDAEEYKSFKSELGRLSEKIRVIAEILWFINSSLKKRDMYVTLQEVLRLKLEDVDIDDGISRNIYLSRCSSKESSVVNYELPKGIWKRLNSQISPDALYAFANKNRGPLLPSYVAKFFKKAGEKAGIKFSTSSLSLRPSKKSKKVRNLINPVETLTTDQLKEISIIEWENLCIGIPNLKSRTGKPPKYDQRLVFNRILYHLKTGIPYREPSSEFPKWKSVHSQLRRWIENGIFTAVMSARSINISK